jgi:hypothetical protein
LECSILSGAIRSLILLLAFRFKFQGNVFSSVGKNIGFMVLLLVNRPRYFSSDKLFAQSVGLCPAFSVRLSDVFAVISFLPWIYFLKMMALHYRKQPLPMRYLKGFFGHRRLLPIP